MENNNQKQKEYYKKWRDAHPDYEKNWERKHLDKVRASKRAWANRNREYFSRYRKQKREVYFARGVTYRMIATGKIKRPGKCSKCPETSNIHAHHPDYSKPLEIVWLCLSCHLAEHGKAIRTQELKD